MQHLVATGLGRLVVAGALMSTLAWQAHAGPVSIEYELASLGGTQYEYRYTVMNVSLGTPVEWFSIDFDPALFDESSLAISSTGTGDWSEIILGSFLAVPAQFDAYYLGGNPLGVGDSASGFAVRFSWLGPGTPGAQMFTIWDTASADILYTDVTTAVNEPPVGVPEPASGALAVIALAAAGAARRRGRRTPA